MCAKSLWKRALRDNICEEEREGGAYQRKERLTGQHMGNSLRQFREELWGWNAFRVVPN